MPFLHGLASGLARDLDPAGVPVETVAPGCIAGTGFTAAWSAERVDPIISETPLERGGTVDEIAATILFFCGEYRPRISQVIG